MLNFIISSAELQHKTDLYKLADKKKITLPLYKIARNFVCQSSIVPVNEPCRVRLISGRVGAILGWVHKLER